MITKLLLGVLVAATVAGGAEEQTSAPPPAARDTLSRFAAALEVLHKHYIEPARLSEPPHTTAALRAYVESLDPEARLLTPGAAVIVASAPPARLQFLSAGIAYLRLPDFTTAAVEQLRRALSYAQTTQARGLILDIRNNPGGEFGAAIAAAQMFLPADVEIVTLIHSTGPGATFSSDKRKKFTTPVVLLVNSGTAAEAEFFTGALCDHKRARLVGSKTAGRGRFFSQFALPDGSALLLPTAYYLTPSRQKFHGTGFSPDESVSMPAGPASFGAFDWVNDKRAILATDLPLARALDLLSK